MMLQGRNAVVYGAGGAVGGAIARAFAREGARVFLTGRTMARLEPLAKELDAPAAQVDALDAAAVEAHLDRIGPVDISVNAIGVDHSQGTPLREMTVEEYALPIDTYTRTQFVTATAAGRHMARRRSGVILTMSTTAARFPALPTGGFGTACAAVEALSLQLAAEVGPDGVRVVCLRPHAMPETAAMGSHVEAIWGRFAARAGVSLDEFLAGPSAGVLGRNPTLAETADTAAFLASDAAGAVTAAVVNLSSGTVIG